MRVELRGVTHRFGERVVLQDVDLVLDEHRIGIVGANGSGKSTLARMLNGLVVPSEGTVQVDGLDTARQGAAVRRAVGFVFTDPDAQIVMPTVAEDVAFSLRRSRLPRAELDARVAAALDRLGLSHLAGQSCHRLSGGEKQLLALAAVLVAEPRLLVCDEPTTLLDARNARRVAGLLAGLPQQVVLVTHQLDQLAGFDRVVVVDRGRVLADGAQAHALDAYRRVIDAEPDPVG
jgi:biotin transport system ATP-binding protein